MAYLILVRHGMSEWNETGEWTGWTDVDLTKKGMEEARHAGHAIGDIHIDVAFISSLRRSEEMLQGMEEVIGKKFEVISDKALDERSYGIYTGKNKWQVEKEVGEEEFHNIRRSWDHPIPQGETLKDVYDRVVPYYESAIVPKLKQGKNVLISAHGNSLRALVKHLEDLTNEQLMELEIGIGEVYLYTMDENAKILAKEIRATNEEPGTV